MRPHKVKRFISLTLLLVPLAAVLATSALHAANLEDLLKSGEERLRHMDFGGAGESFNAALQLARESQDRAAQALAHRGLARSMFFFPEGEAEARLARALHRSLQDEAGEAADLSALSENYQARSYFSKALEVLAEALAIERRLGLRAEEAQTLENQAMVQRIMGSYEEALASLKAALDTLHGTGIMSSSEVRLATKLGDLNADLGRYAEAEKYLKAAIAGARRSEFQVPPATWARLSKKSREQNADAYKAFGAAAQSLAGEEEPAPDFNSDPELLRLTLDAFAEDFEQQSRRSLETAQALVSLETVAPKPPLGQAQDAGRTYHYLAEGYAKQARAFRQALASGKLDDEVTEALVASAKSRHVIFGAARVALQANTDEQLPYKDALDAFSCQQDALATLGRIYQQRDYSKKEATAKKNEAWDLFEKAQAFVPGGFAKTDFVKARKLGLPIPTPANSCGYTTSFHHEVLWHADLKAAEGHPKEAIEDYLINAARSSTLRPTAWQRIASLYAAMGANDQAIEYYRKAIDATEGIQGQLLRGELVASWASHQEPLYAQAIRLLYDLKQPAQAFEYAERARARAFLNQIGNRRLSAVGVPAELDKALQDMRQRLIELEGLEQRGGAYALMPNGKGEAGSARKLYQDLLTRVTQVSPEYASLLKVDTVTLTQVQGEILDDHTSLIEYFVLDDKLLAWVIDRSAVTWLALPISATQLNERISYLRQLIARQEPSREEATALHEALFAPLEPYLRHHDVIVVPQGPLHSLPFGALWNAKSNRYVAQDYALTLVPSASVLRFVHRKLKPAASRLLALGNPDDSLPHAEEEVRAIAHLFNAVPWVGKEALESRLSLEGGDAGIVHLAAHATYDPLRPFLTHIGLAADRGAPVSDGKSDGQLHVYEIYGLDLKHANLVVLSACDTALGPHDEGDDLIGLPRAFLYAGASTVLSTLWRVDDKATATFMERFYSQIRQGKAAAEALQTAQQDLLGQAATQEPYFWAGFTLTGAAETTSGLREEGPPPS